jgi:hypothetical protein
MERAAPNPNSFGATPKPSQGPEQSGSCGRVSLEAEVPEILFEGMRSFIKLNPDWDQYSVITSALAGFLFQNGCQEQTVTQHYLDTLFCRR